MLVQTEVSTEMRLAHRRQLTPALEGGVVIRRATHDDADGLRAMFVRSSARTIYLRFHLPYRVVPEPLIERLCGTNGRGGGAFVAVSGDKIVGHVMYAMEECNQSEAEVALVVEDGRQGSGLGKRLLTVASEEARRAGVDALTCFTLRENRRVLDLARGALPGVHARCADGTLRIRVPLRSTMA